MNPQLIKNIVYRFARFATACGLITGALSAATTGGGVTTLNAGLPSPGSSLEVVGYPQLAVTLGAGSATTVNGVLFTPYAPNGFNSISGLNGITFAGTSLVGVGWRNLDYPPIWTGGNDFSALMSGLTDNSAAPPGSLTFSLSGLNAAKTYVVKVISGDSRNFGTNMTHSLGGVAQSSNLVSGADGMISTFTVTGETSVNLVVSCTTGAPPTLQGLLVTSIENPLIPATVESVSSELTLFSRQAVHSIDGSGMVGDGSAGSSHNRGEGFIAWTSNGNLGVYGSPAVNDFDPEITYDLGGIYNVTKIREWGYNETTISRIGPNEVEILTSDDNVTFTSAGIVNFAQAPGTNGYFGHEIPVSLVGVRYIRLDIKTNHDGAVFDGTGAVPGTVDGRSLTGLSEIRFEGIRDEISAPAEVSKFLVDGVGSLKVPVTAGANLLSLSQPTLSGADASLFSVSSWPATINPVKVGNIVVSFNSGGAPSGIFHATLSVPTDNPTTPLIEVALVVETGILTRVISNGSESVTVRFTPHSVRGPNFSVLVQNSSGSLVSHVAPPSRIFIGTVDEDPGAIAAGLLREDGSLLTRISFIDGSEWTSDRGVTHDFSHIWLPQYPTSTVPGAGGAGGRVYAAEIGVDAASEEYEFLGSDVDTTVEMIELCTMATNMIYLRDAGITHRLGRVIVRTSPVQDPYENNADIYPLLNTVRTQWNSVLPASTHDIGLVVKPTAGGGLAYIAQIGNSNAYSSNGTTGPSDGDFTQIWRHEVGHNWGAGHFVGGQPEGGTIMSGNVLARISSCELYSILFYRNQRLGVLDDLGPYSYPIPPRASLDTSSYGVGTTNVTIDVLNNDHDANGQSITILDFDSTTQRGATVTRSVGTGPGGRDRLVYTPNPDALFGVDFFKYRIEDSSGRQGLGYVTLQGTGPAPLIAPATVQSVSSDLDFDDRAAAHSIDRSGLSGTGGNDSYHSSGESGIVWTTNGNGSAGGTPDFSPEITYDLGSVVTVKTIREWGYNQTFPYPAGNTNIGPDEVELFAGPDLGSMTSRGTLHFALAPGISGYYGTTHSMLLPGVRYVRLVIKSNYDGAVFDGTGSKNGTIDGRGFTGLSEIAFELADGVVAPESVVEHLSIAPTTFNIPVVNAGGASVSLLGLTVVGPDSGRFSITGYPASIGAGAAGLIEVTFNGLLAPNGSYDAILDFTTSESGNPHVSVGMTVIFEQPDRDSDGIRDSWEDEWELNPDMDDSGFDPEHDGYTHLEEYVLGLDPNQWDANPLVVGSESVSFTLPAATGPGYEGLQRRVKLRSSVDLEDWGEVLADVVANGGAVVVPYSKTGPRLFFRLEVLLESP